MSEPYLLIIDGSSLLSTQFYGNLPPAVLMAKTVEEKERHFSRIMQTSTGVYTNGIFGFLRYLLKVIRQQKPTHLAVAWDITRDTFRRRLCADYKANRSETIVPLKEQFALCQDILRRIGVVQYMSTEFEADDYSGSLAATFEGEIPVRILTKDHDYLQLADERTTIWLLQQAQQIRHQKRGSHRSREGISHDSGANRSRVRRFPGECRGIKGFAGRCVR